MKSMKNMLLTITAIFAFCLLLTSCTFSSQHKQVYTVKFITDESTLVEKVRVDAGNKLVEPTIPEKEHYEVAGWYNDDQQWDFENDVVTESVILTAKWQLKQYEVAFVADAEVIDVKYYDIENTEITLPAVPEKEGYTGVWEAFELTSGDREVVAIYTPITYTVTFKADGVEVETISYDVENTEIVEPTVPAKEHYTGAWEAYTLSTGEVVVNAIYTPVEYKVTFKAEGEEVETLTYDVENTTVVEPSVPEKTGYTGAWEVYTLTHGDVVVNAVYTVVTYTVTFKADEVEVDTQTYTVEDRNIVEPSVPAKEHYTAAWEVYTLTHGDVVVNAVYTGVKYDLVYVLNEGTNPEEAPVQYVYAAELELPTPTRKGYKFVGWYENAELTGEPVEVVAKEVNGTYKLFAKWEIIVYTITYYLDNTPNAVAMTDTYTILDSVELMGVAQANRTFAGWYESVDYSGEAVTDIEVGTTGDKVYYAKWI